MRAPQTRYSSCTIGIGRERQSYPGVKEEKMALKELDSSRDREQSHKMCSYTVKTQWG